MRLLSARSYAVTAAALAGLLTLAGTGQAAPAPSGTQPLAAATVSPVPYAMDSSNQAAWWTPVATYKGVGQYTYFAFNEPGSTAATHRPAIARRAPDGTWSRLPLLTSTGAQAEFTDDIGHNQPSVARDGSGRLHVFTSMHCNPWRYFRSTAAGGNVTDHASELPDAGQGITYPVLTTAPNGDLYLTARVGCGNDQRPGKLYRWDNAASRWTTVATFAAAQYRSVYPDDLAVDAAGRVHILYEWSKAPSSAFRHQLSYLRYDPATGTFADSTGATATVPATPGTADVIQDLTTGEQWSTDNTGYTGPAVQSAKLTLSGSSPRIAYRYRSADSGGVFRVYFAAPSGGGWARQTVYAGGQTAAALGITRDETEAERVYYVTASGTDRVFAARAVGGAWQSQSVAPGLAADRLAVRRDSDGVDVLYLPDTAHGTLHYGRR
ncbi:BNR-4 repeat-containing protein [Streptomyces sp. TRM66268-LWL]|uniref:BNR-4 repeat-containing protein n=1 Tax=Streptomyces polyasparticus TaxID=2767826 RepID=A0ABR7SK68_9ACTN|nr:BNR-4 repeat-containing protein [Streptomyces polyasparticus]MBC9715860.1 BNR-4 repeat-containing protein [Streptomyces polyasparticus]